VTHIYIKPSSNQHSTTSREASAAGRLRPNALVLTGLANLRVVGYKQAVANLAHSSLRVSQSAFPHAALLDLRWNCTEGANRMLKFLRHALKSRARLD
jgi:hypothetical protein